VAESLPTWEDLAAELPRGWFGYRIPSVHRHLKHLTAQDELKERAWTQDMQRLAVELGRLEERHKTLGDLTDHMKIECDRLKLQIAQQKINARFAEEGVQREIARLEEEHRQRVALLEASATRADLEAQAYETKLWQLTESLTRVLQDAQAVANQQLALDSADSVWTQFCLTVIGDVIAPDTPQMMVRGLLESRRVRPGLVQVGTRAGRRLGYLRAVILSLAPPSIVAYVVPEVGIIPAQDVQILRLRNVTVSSEFHILNEEDLLSQYTRSRPATSDDISATPPAVSEPPATNVEPEPEPSEHQTRESSLAFDLIETPEASAPAMAETAINASSNEDTTLEQALLSVAKESVSSQPDHFTPTITQTSPDTLQKSERVAIVAHPAWFDPLGKTQKTTSTELALPGVTEAQPPSRRRLVIPPVVQPRKEGVEKLPGLMAKSSIPAPRWSDAGPVSTSARVSEPPASTPSLEEIEAGPALDSQESGALDVRAFLLGKRVGQDIRDANQNTIARSGEIITAELVERVEDAGYLPDLIVHMVF
jgi:hypothetical protein